VSAAIATGCEETKALISCPYRVRQVTREPWKAVGASLSPVAPGFATGEPLLWEAEPLFPLDRCSHYWCTMSLERRKGG
jgi:hypothetical protein